MKCIQWKLINIDGSIVYDECMVEWFTFGVTMVFFLCIPFDQMNMMKLTYPLIYLLKIKFSLLKKLYNYILIKISSTKFSNGILNPKIWISHLIGTSQNEKINIDSHFKIVTNKITKSYEKKFFKTS
jgi:hypothetical protein